MLFRKKNGESTTRKFFTAFTIFPCFTKKQPSRVTPVMSPLRQSTDPTSDNRLTKIPSSHRAIISSTVVVPPENRKALSGAVYVLLRATAFRTSYCRFFNTPFSTHVMGTVAYPV